MRLRIPIVVVALGGLLGACVGDEEAQFAVQVTADTVTFSRRGDASAPWIRFELPVLVRNTGRVPLYDAFCAVRVEREVAGAWQTVWSPVCAAAAGQLAGLPPGAERRVVFVVTSPVGTAGSYWAPPVAGGPYRYVLGLTARAPDVLGPRGPALHRSSNAFRLRESPEESRP